MSLEVRFANKHAHPVFLSVDEKGQERCREILLMPDEVFVLNATGPISTSTVKLFHPPQPRKGIMEP